jgi:hypothetical protein
VYPLAWSNFLMAYEIPAVKGLVSDISQYMLDSAVREYPQFAIASAMQIIAACAQGTYTLPDGRPLCLYQILLAPASSGKGAYLAAAKRILMEVAQQMVSSEPGSREGLRHGLQEWNARAILVDEVQDFFAKLASDNPHIQGIGTDLKEIWSGVEKLQSIATKSNISEAVLNPLVSFYGTGVIKETAQHFCGSTAGGGLFSRFQIFFADEVVKAKRHISRSNIANICGDLRMIFHMGKTEEWKPKGIPQWNDYRQMLLLPPAKREIIAPQMKPMFALKITQEADDLLWEQRQHWETYLLDDADSIQGAIYDRASTAGLIYAACHALGCKRIEINKEDLCIGLALAEMSAINAVKLSTNYSASNDDENDAKKILRALDKHGPMDKRTLQKMSNMYGKRYISALTGLEQSKNVVSTLGKYQKIGE